MPPSSNAFSFTRNKARPLVRRGGGRVREKRPDVRMVDRRADDRGVQLASAPLGFAQEHMRLDVLRVEVDIGVDCHLSGTRHIDARRIVGKDVSQLAAEAR